MLPRKHVDLYFSLLSKILVPITNGSGILGAMKANHVTFLKGFLKTGIPFFYDFHLFFATISANNNMLTFCCTIHL
jgi:hypothetical protein